MMLEAKPTENVAATLKEIADAIITSPLVNDVSPYDHEHLAVWSDGKATDCYGYSFRFKRVITVGDRGYEAETTLRIQFDDKRSLTREERTDEDGNLWSVYTPEVDASWPSYGTGQGAMVACKRAHLNLEVANLAGEIDLILRGRVMYSIRSSKEELAAAKEASLKFFSKRKIEVLVGKNCDRMRVGSERRFEDSTENGHELAAGDYDVTINSKTYKVNVGSTHAFYFTRTA